MNNFTFWITLEQLMQRWQTAEVETVFEAIRAGLPVYEKERDFFLTGMNELSPEEASERYYLGGEYGCKPLGLMLFKLQEVIEFEQAHAAKGRVGGVIELNNYPLKGHSEAAVYLGVSKKSISNYVKQGMPRLNPCKETGGEYRFNGDKIKAWYDQHQEGNRQKLHDNLKK